jgi:hypothetical protein
VNNSKHKERLSLAPGSKEHSAARRAFKAAKDLVGEAMVTFLGVNGCAFEATEPEVVTEFLAVADGRVSEAALADWIRQHGPKRR